MPHSPWLRRPTAPRRRAVAPRLEQLEDRCLLATIVGATSVGTLVRFDSTTPSAQTTIGTLSGFNTNQAIAGLDFRPSTGELYGLGFFNGTGQIYKINPTTAAASPVGNPFSTKLTGTQFAFDFDPVADKIRVVSNTGENYRVDPNSGSAVAVDGSIPSSDTISGIAYDHNFKGATATTLFGYDTANDKLVTVNPATGAVSPIGSSNVTAQQPGLLGFDIDADGAAYLNIITGNSSGLFTANLNTGAVTSVGSFGATMVDITVAPTVSFSVTGFPRERTVTLASNLVVTAQDVYGLTATGYAGTVHFTSSDPAATLPADTLLTKGSATVSVTFNTPGNQTVTATDVATSAATPLVADINPGAAASNPGPAVNINGTLYFAADDGTHGRELWKSDGTAAGTALVADINAGVAASNPGNLTVVGNTVFFTANDGTNGTELWKTDGTTTTLVKDINPGAASSNPGFLVNANGTLFFSADDGNDGNELWKSDGSAAGTVLVADIAPGADFFGTPNSSFPVNLVALGSTVFFSANDGTSDRELWKSDGSTAGTVLVKDINTGGGSFPGNLTAVGSTLFFTANDGLSGLELWKSDGSTAGTILVKDIAPGAANSNPGGLTSLNGMLFFAANDGTSGRELWKSDGSTAGTVLVKDINPGAAFSFPGDLTAAGGTLFFIADDGTNGAELWKSDGSAAGTVLVKDIFPGSNGSFITDLTAVGSLLFLSANDGTDGQELWRSDGTAAGTFLIRDINPGGTNSTPGNLLNVNGTLFFSADDGTHGFELWKTDGTPTISGSEKNILVLPNSEVIGLTAAAQLVRFNTATPGSVTVIGNVGGVGTNQSLVGIDFRPKTGQLYGMGFFGGTGQLYTINPTTAVCTAVGGPFSTTLSGFNYGFDFDPVNDVVRITSDANENLRVNPDTGALISSDTLLTPSTANVVGIAYDRNFVGSTTTTLYGYDTSTNNLVTIGNVNGTPGSPNGGQVISVGASNETVTVGTSANVGFDIDANGGAYLNLVAGGSSKFYTADLGSGSITLNGAFPSGFTLNDVAVAPAVSFRFVRLDAPHVAGASSPVDVLAVDAFGNVVPAYHGTVHFTSSDPTAVLPADATLTNGAGSFNMTFNTVGTDTLTATDTAIGAVTGTANVAVVRATNLVGVTTNGVLVHFSSATPGSVTGVAAVSGLAAGQRIVGVDFRPATGGLYALGFAAGTAQLYTINPTTAAAAAVGSGFALSPSDTSFGFGFDPVADVIRVTSNNGENVRVDPASGAVIANDSALSPSSLYAGVAYDRNLRGATQTTLYSYDLTNNKLVTIGGADGSPSPDGGQVTNVGASGFTADSSTAGYSGFDVGGDGVAYLNIVVGQTPGLYTVNLGTGVAELVSNFSGVVLVGLSEAPATAFTVAGFPSPTAANTPGSFVVTAVDPYGLTVPTYNGTVTFTSSDPAATLPGDSPLTSGVGVFTASFATQGTHDLTASDAAVPTINGTQSGIIVGQGGGGGGGGGGNPPPTSTVDRIGVVRGSPDRTALFSLDTNGNGVFDSGDSVFTFGLSSDKFLVGDWANLGFDSVGVVRPTSSGVAQFSLDSNGNNTFDNSDSVFFFGLNSDTFLTGDWNGSGTSKIGVVRPGADAVPVFSLDSNGNGVFDSGDTVTSFGLNGDTFVVGDWNGDGRADIGIVRPTSSGIMMWALDSNGNGVFDSSDSVFFFGLNSDTPVVGDWTGSGTTKIGVVRAQPNGTSVFALDANGDGVFDDGDNVFGFGLATDRFLVGKWRQPGQLVAGDGALNAALPPLALDATFQAVANQAIAAWQQAGLDPQHVAQLQSIHYSVAPLGGAALGESLGGSITLDATAAGHGWSEAPAPQAGKMDLFTVLSHEMGHTLGLDHSLQPGEVMFDSLLPGVRKVPTTADVDALFASMGH